MCGIAGLVDPGLAPDALAAAARAMGAALAHRGPDGDGLWCADGVGLAHRRLAIVDLSEAGAQPMASADGRWILSYNGELYDAPERRADLPGYRFRGSSDTEVLVELIARRGVRGALDDLDGIFAFAAYDRAERRLWLARDRLGVKPLYYAAEAGRLLFGSELRALTACPGFRPEIDPRAVSSLLRHGYVPAPGSIFSRVAKLPPATLLSWRPGEAPVLEAYWRLDAPRPAFAGDDAEAVEALDGLLSRAVRRQLMSDVPLGAFLSGGIDSALVAALMAEAGGAKTFTVAFDEPRLDESARAAAIAAHLGTAHTTIPVGEAEALALVEGLPDLLDEPLADPSAIPTHLVAAATRRAGITVALTGDGGDELFAGYDRYRLALRHAARVEPLPLPARRLAAGAIRALPRGASRALGRALPLPFAGADPAETLRKAAAVLPLDGAGVYRRLLTLNPDSEALANGVPGLPSPMDFSLDGPLLAAMRARDAAAYLPDDVLAKVDRTGMAVGLEARVPFLDRRVVEFAFSLPDRLLVRDGVAKWLPRRVLARRVPPALFEGPKRGFGVPLARWLRGPLRPWARDLLLAPGAGGGYLDAGRAGAMLEAHLDGREDRAVGLWPLLVFEAWRRR